MAKKLEMFWDVGSPYTYLALTQIDGLRKRTGAEVVLRPFLLGGVFKAAGNTMPASVMAKAVHLREDLRRWRDHYGVPMKLPPDEVPFPLVTLQAMRTAVAADRRGQGERYARAIFQAYWVEGRDVSQPEEIAKVVRAIDLDPAALAAEAASQEVKDALRASTDEAVERGAFGAPTFFLGNEMFWGNDRLHFVEAALKESRPRRSGSGA